MKKIKGSKKTKIDVDSLFRKAGYEPPKINFEKAIEAAKKSGKARVDRFTYEAFAEALGFSNSNNINKWKKESGLSFDTIKMMLYVLNCGIEDLIEPAKKKLRK